MQQKARTGLLPSGLDVLSGLVSFPMSLEPAQDALDGLVHGGDLLVQLEQLPLALVVPIGEVHFDPVLQFAKAAFEAIDRFLHLPKAHRMHRLDANSGRTPEQFPPFVPDTQDEVENAPQPCPADEEVDELSVSRCWYLGDHGFRAPQFYRQWPAGFPAS